jgi:hypothetical protein
MIQHLRSFFFLLLFIERVALTVFSLLYVYKTIREEEWVWVVSDRKTCFLFILPCRRLAICKYILETTYKCNLMLIILLPQFFIFIYLFVRKWALTLNRYFIFYYNKRSKWDLFKSCDMDDERLQHQMN